MSDDRERGFYRAFEDRFRGSRDQIKERLRVYIPFVKSLKSVGQVPAALDLGCGRGEWLELLTENGLDPIGVDIDEGMLEATRSRGLNVAKSDAISYLQEQPAESLSIVSAFHVVEHLKFVDLQVLTKEALRVLKPGGVLILETPNPENLKVGTSNFYLDPTHVNPIPTGLLLFLVEYYGFSRVKALRLQEPDGLESAEQVTLSDVLSGVSPDYAIVAQKGGDEAATMASDSAFATEHGLTLDLLAARFDAGIPRLNQISAELEGIHARVIDLECRLLECQAAADRALHETDAMRKSMSWRLTRPLRALRRWTFR